MTGHLFVFVDWWSKTVESRLSYLKDNTRTVSSGLRVRHDSGNVFLIVGKRFSLCYFFGCYLSSSVLFDLSHCNNKMTKNHKWESRSFYVRTDSITIFSQTCYVKLLMESIELRRLPRRFWRSLIKSFFI